MCEMSCASNCPNLPYLFVGFKKVQQLLASKETLARCVSVCLCYYLQTWQIIWLPLRMQVSIMILTLS